MKSGLDARGFTIIETMVVLAVTAILLFSVVLVMGGKTSQAEFSSAMNDLKNNLQQTADYVSDGNYPNNAAVTVCPQQGVGSQSVSPSTQGTYSGCTYLGVMLGLNFTSSTKYNTYTIIGEQCTLDTSEFSNCITPTGNIASEDPTIGLQSTQYISSNITLVSITLNSITKYCLSGCGGNNFPPYIGFLASAAQASSVTDSNVLSPGSQQINPYSFTGQSLLSSSGTLAQDSEVDLCFASKTTNQSGKLILGGNSNSQTTVSLQIYGDQKC